MSEPKLSLMELIDAADRHWAGFTHCMDAANVALDSASVEELRTALPRMQELTGKLKAGVTAVR